jgi:flagellar motor switch/type III secretory pathway protein FliN
MSSSPNSSSSSDRIGATDWLMDVVCPVDVILGTAVLKVAECSRLSIGSVVRLRQGAGADLQVRLGGTTFAAGEAVMVDDSLSIRIGRILPPSLEELA